MRKHAKSIASSEQSLHLNIVNRCLHNEYQRQVFIAELIRRKRKYTSFILLIQWKFFRFSLKRNLLFNQVIDMKISKLLFFIFHYRENIWKYSKICSYKNRSQNTNKSA